MAGGRSKPAVTRKQSSAEFFGKHDVSHIIGRQVVAELPNPGQQQEVGIASNAQVQEILDRLIRAVC